MNVEDLALFLNEWDRERDEDADENDDGQDETDLHVANGVSRGWF